MLSKVSTLATFEKDLVKGYYRQNSNAYYIPQVVMKLSMLYIWILDEFTFPKQSKQEDTAGSTSASNGICITGLNNTIARCVNPSLPSTTIFGANTINAKRNCFYHWRFKIISGHENCDNHDFMIGVNQMNDDLTTQNSAYLFIGSHGLKQHGLSTTYYSKKRFHKNNDILDMYLDLQRGELRYIVNNNPLNVAFDGLDVTKSYKLQCILSNKNSTLELLAHHSSSSNGFDLVRSHLFESINYIRSQPNIEKKLKLFEFMQNANKLNENELVNDYIDCLVANRCFDEIYAFFELFSFSVHIIHQKTICQIAAFFYFERNDFVRALNVYKMCKDDQIFIANHQTVEVAFCYEHSQKDWFCALKYYELGLETESKLEQNGKNECLHHMGAIYFNHIYDYEKALECFLKMGADAINRRDLESAIASCYDQLKDYKSSIAYFEKYEKKYKNKASVSIAIALIHSKLHNIKKAEKYFERALDLDTSKSDWMVHSKYGYHLLNTTKNYKKALIFFEKAMQISTSSHQLSESYKCLGATYDKLGDMHNAIKFTKKVLQINPNDADALNNAGYFFLTMKQYELAYKHLLKSLEIFPCGELTTGNIGICLFEMGRFEEAKIYLQRVFDDLPSDYNHCDVGPRCLECFAVILYKEEQKYAQSEEILEKLMKHRHFAKHFEKKDEVFYLVSRVCLAQMKFDKALKYLKKAKKFNPNRKIYENQIKILKNNEHIL